MRRAPVAFAAGAFAAAIGACAIDEVGLLESDGGADVNVPEACATLDAACLGPLDPGWTPVAITDGGCAAGWSDLHLRTNARDVDGSCACGACAPIGSYACEAGVPISGGNNCGDPPLATATPGQCTDVNATQHLKAHAVTAGGQIRCFAPNDAGQGALSDDLALCVPGCTADFCGGASRCIVHDGAIACPSGFSYYGQAGTGVDPGCAPCSCDAGAPGECGGAVTAFFQSGCNAADDAGVYAVDSCNYIQQQYKSVVVTLTPPQPSCTTSTDPLAGDASLTDVKTICCR